VLKERALVLNKNWTAVATTTIHKAMSLLCRETAQVICPETYEAVTLDEWIRRSESLTPEEKAIKTPRFRVRMPEVILLRKFGGRPKRLVAFTRRNLYKRDIYTCQYCGKKLPTEDLTIDHVVPKSHGGKTTWENCVLACYNCNAKKANKTLRESGLKLLKKPSRPEWYPLNEVEKKDRPKSWQQFVSDEYWNSELRD